RTLGRALTWDRHAREIQRLRIDFPVDGKQSRLAERRYVDRRRVEEGLTEILTGPGGVVVIRHHVCAGGGGTDAYRRGNQQRRSGEQRDRLDRPEHSVVVVARVRP